MSSARRLARAHALGLMAAATLLPRGLRAQTVPTIRVGVEAVEAYAEPLLGIDGGIFARAGLTIEPTILRSAGAIAAAIAGGALDAGLTDTIVLANAANHGVPLLAIASSGLFRKTDLSSGLFVAKGSPPRTAKSFEGLAIAIPTVVSLTTVAIRMWLARNGVNLANVRFVEMPFSDMTGALQRDVVSAAFLVEPFVTMNASAIQHVADPYAEISDTFPISLLAASRPWLTANADTARRFVAALYETARWSNANHDVTGPMLAKYTKLELDVVRKMRRSTFGTSLEPRMLQPILDAAFSYNLIDRQTNAGDLIARV